jgi:hypothetical protein
VLAHYAHHLDAGEVDAWLHLFAEDIHWKTLVVDTLILELNGRGAMEEYWRPRITQVGGGAKRARHVVANTAILSLSDSTAQITAYAIVISRDQVGGLPITLTGDYRGLLVKLDGAWSIREWAIILV